MQIHIGYHLRFGIPAPTPMLLQLHVLPNRYAFARPETLTLVPNTSSETFNDLFGNTSRRLIAPTGAFDISSDGVVEVSGQGRCGRVAGHPASGQYAADRHASP